MPETNPKIVSVALPDYVITHQPDYATLGPKIDKVIEDNFSGEVLIRALSMDDHPQYTLDQLVNIILETGTDKYDPMRKGVEHEAYEPYKPDIQAGLEKIENGKILDNFGATTIKLFYENVLLDRGYRLRVDLLTLYDPKQMALAEKVDDTKPSVASHLEQYLQRFNDPDHKNRALIGIVKILR